MNKFLISIVLIILSHVSWGQSLEVEISSDSVLIGNTVKVTYILEDVEGSLPSPTFTNCTIISGPNVSSSVTIINGNKSSKTTYTYIIRPETKGIHTIESLFIEEQESQLYSTPLVFEVVPNPDNIIEENNGFEQSQIFEFRSFPFDFKKEKENEPKQPKRKLKRL